MKFVKKGEGMKEVVGKLDRRNKTGNVLSLKDGFVSSERRI